MTQVIDIKGKVKVFVSQNLASDTTGIQLATPHGWRKNG